MPTGRKPKPREQRVREGNPGKRPLPERVDVNPAPAGELAEPPRHLPAAAREIWREIVPVLEQVGMLNGVDVPALEFMCIQYARARKAGEVVAEEGFFALGSTGQIVEHPALELERKAAALFLRFAEHYALTPIARTRMGLAELARRSMAEELKGLIAPPSPDDEAG